MDPLLLGVFMDCKVENRAHHHGNPYVIFAIPKQKQMFLLSALEALQPIIIF